MYQEEVASFDSRFIRVLRHEYYVLLHHVTFQSILISMRKEVLKPFLEYLQPLIRKANIRTIKCSHDRSDIIDMLSEFFGERTVSMLFIGRPILMRQAPPHKVDLCVIVVAYNV